MGAVRMRVLTADKNITIIHKLIRCLDSHSDGTHSLQSIHFLSNWWNATFLQTWWWNKLILILDGLRVSTFSANHHFWLNYSFKDLQHYSAWAHALLKSNCSNTLVKSIRWVCVPMCLALDQKQTTMFIYIPHLKPESIWHLTTAASSFTWINTMFKQ